MDASGQLQDFVTAGLCPEEHQRFLELPEAPAQGEYLREMPHPLERRRSLIRPTPLGSYSLTGRIGSTGTARSMTFCHSVGTDSVVAMQRDFGPTGGKHCRILDIESGPSSAPPASRTRCHSDGNRTSKRPRRVPSEFGADRDLGHPKGGISAVRSSRSVSPG